MKNKLEILLVEDDKNACNEFINEIDKNQEDFYLINVTNNSCSAFELLLETSPDVVILDLELHHGGGNGLDFLKQVQNANLEHPPYVLITTNNISSVTHQIARNLGADFIITKNQENYSEKAVLELLKNAKHVILSRKSNHCRQNSNEYEAQTEKRILRQINSELLAVGVNPKSIGFNYLTDAILMTIQNPVQHLCNEIGKKYNKSENSVERAMQNAINRAWNTSDINDLLTHYTAKISSEKGVPTLTEFIYYYAQKIKNNF